MKPDLEDAPYHWPGPFREADAQRFFGRLELTKLVTATASAAPFSIVFGPPGVGKTSLLRAGVMAALNARPDHLAVYCSDWRDCPATSLKAAAADALGPDAPDDRLTLPDYFSAAAARTGRRVTILLDRFDHYLRKFAPDDQLSRELPAVVNDNAVTAVASLRESAFHLLDRFEAHVPSLFDSYRRVEHLTEAQALDVIHFPLHLVNRGLPTHRHREADRDFADALIDQLSRYHLDLQLPHSRAPEPAVRRVRAPHLQAVLAAVWKRTQLCGHNILTRETLDSMGGAARVYEEVSGPRPAPQRDRDLALMLDLIVCHDLETGAERIHRYLVENNYLDSRGEPTALAWRDARKAS